MSLNQILLDEYKPYMNVRFNNVIVDGAINVPTITGNLQQTYDNSPAPPTIEYNDIDGPIIIKNNPSEGQTLLTIEDNGGTTEYYNLEKDRASLGSNNTLNNAGYVLGSDNMLNSNGNIIGNVNILGANGNILGNQNNLNNDGIIIGDSNVSNAEGVSIGNSNNLLAVGYAIGNGNTINNSGYSIGDNNTINADGIVIGNNNTLDSSGFIINPTSNSLDSNYNGGSLIGNKGIMIISENGSSINPPFSGVPNTNGNTIFENAKIELSSLGGTGTIYTLNTLAGYSYYIEIDLLWIIKDSISLISRKGNMAITRYIFQASNVAGSINKQETLDYAVNSPSPLVYTPGAFSTSISGSDIIFTVTNQPLNPSGVYVLTNIKKTVFQFE